MTAKPRRPWPTEQQQVNARINAGQASRQHHQHPAADFDWEAAVARLKKMLDNLEEC